MRFLIGLSFVGHDKKNILEVGNCEDHHCTPVELERDEVVIGVKGLQTREKSGNYFITNLQF
jgi:hypothetical protein